MSLFVAIQGSVKPASAANSSAVVIGAGTTAVNGVYTPRGELNGKPYYNLDGQPDDPSIYAIIWTGLAWQIFNEETLYYGTSGTGDFPWEESGWDVEAGTPPAPTVTEV